MGDQPAMKLVHSEPDTVLIHNDGPSIVFYGFEKRDPVGKIDSGHSKRIPKNCVYWSAVGQANVRFSEN